VRRRNRCGGRLDGTVALLSYRPDTGTEGFSDAAEREAG